MNGDHSHGNRLLLIAAVSVAVVLGFMAGAILVHISNSEKETPALRSKISSTVTGHNLAELEVQLYFGSTTANYLYAEKRVIQAGGAVSAAAAIIRELLQGPHSAGFVSTIPEQTTLRHLFVTEDEIAYVDLSAEISRGHPGGIIAELLTIYGVVNALALNLKEIQRVQILVDGEVVPTLAGHVDVSHPLPANLALVH
ncbi:MAG: GerMN domain-containing protein [Deltaproteobacteria bacterium]|nr:GerMN domain-containing protein [Deltaproteobacteria bacterium]MBW2071074.1 GerMN domain-containing protein [Deltaproteobacteria bacterium]